MRNRGKTTELVVCSHKKKEANPTWTISDSYIPYKKELGTLALERSLYITIMKEICWEISLELIRNIRSIKLPFRLGDLGIKKRKNNKAYNSQRIDFNHYNKTGEVKFHCNFHTNKYYFFWDWDNAVFTNRTYYKFVPARGNDKLTGTRGLANWIKHCASDPNIKDYDALIK